MNLILFGPPGAGKGTQSKYIVNKLNSYQISTGEMLRNEIKKNTDIGKTINRDITNGKFVSDEIINKLIKNLISDPTNKNKLIFDGYPRSLSQAKNLDLLLTNSKQRIGLILFLNVNKDTIIKRIEKRKILEKRSDDDKQTILKRYDTYMQNTKPVLDYYSKKENFNEVDGTMEIADISSKIDQIIGV